jgi:hypothetical protein
MDVGNYWVLDGSNPMGCLPGVCTWTWRTDVVGVDTTTVPGVTTYRLDGHEVSGGDDQERNWYSVSPAEIRLWRLEFLEDSIWNTVTITGGIRDGIFPIVVGGFFTDVTTGLMTGGEYNGVINITSQVWVLSYENVTVPLGTYKAYKVRRVLTIPQLGGVVEDLTRWFVPHIGVVKFLYNYSAEDVDTEVLSSMRVKKSIIDVDADGKHDITIYRSGNGMWFIMPSGGGTPYGVGWGGDATDRPVPRDYDGDGKADIAVYRSGTGGWYIMPSGGGAPYGAGWGGNATDRPVPRDYDGDGRADIAVYRSATGIWYIMPSGGGGPYGVGWGGDVTDKPVNRDFDGDGRPDIGVYRTGTGGWYIIPSSTGVPYGVGWGGDATDRPVPRDYDGDGRADIAVYRSGTGVWFIMPSGGGAPYGVGWGGDSSDQTVPADYDGDGKADVAVYRVSTGVWYIIPSSTGVPYGVGWGGDPTDTPPM